MCYRCVSCGFTRPASLCFLQIQIVTITATISRDPAAATEITTIIRDTEPVRGEGDPKEEGGEVCGSGVVAAK